MGLQKTQPPTLKVEKGDAQKIKRGASPKRQRSRQRKPDLPSSDVEFSPPKASARP